MHKMKEFPPAFGYIFSHPELGALSRVLVPLYPEISKVLFLLFFFAVVLSPPNMSRQAIKINPFSSAVPATSLSPPPTSLHRLVSFILHP